MFISLTQYFASCKVKLTLEQAMRAQRGLVWVGGQRHAQAALPPGKRHGTHCTGDWVGSKAGLGECWKFRPPPEFDRQTVQPVASRYTDYIIPANTLLVVVQVN
jgi:hypothetical protein